MINTPTTTEDRRIILEEMNKLVSDWSFLPPNILLRGVFPYLEVEVNKAATKTGKEFCLFGYFKKAKIRSCHFLFPSIKYHKQIPTECYVDFKSVVHIRLESLAEAEFAKIEKLVMKKLRSLSVTYCQLKDTFFAVGKYPNLRSLNISSCNWEHLRGRDWAPENLVNLRSINFETLDIGNEFFETYKLPKLKKVKLTAMTSVDGVRKWANLQHLKRVELVTGAMNDEFFNRNEFSNLRELVLKECHQIDGSKIKKDRFPALTKLTIDGCQSLGDRFFQVLFPSLSHVVIVHSNQIFGRYWNVLKSLTKLEISSMDLNDKIFQKQDFSRLEYLHLEEINELEGLEWNKSLQNLRTLNIRYCHQITNTLFRSSEFPNLEKLVLESLKLSGTRWKPMPQLKEVSIIALNIKDEFFQGKENMLNIKKLTIMRCHRFKGDNWSPLPNCTYLELHGCDGLIDSFFQTTKIPKLQSLILKYIKGTGSKWQQMEDLKSVLFYRCDVKDVFFETQKLEKLKRLIIFRCEDVTLKNWSIPRGLDWSIRMCKNCPLSIMSRKK